MEKFWGSIAQLINTADKNAEREDFPKNDLFLRERQIETECPPADSLP